jgi:type VI secretion system secreted protein Hcp
MFPMADTFVKLGDIKGESVDDKHKDEIEVVSFSWGVANAGGMAHGAGGGAGKATFKELSFVHTLDKASPLLMQACATGQHLKEATLTHRKPGRGQQEYLVIRLSDVLITGVEHAGGDGMPATESVTLVFARVDLEYKAQKPDGSLDAGIHFKYDLKSNKAG